MSVNGKYIFLNLQRRETTPLSRAAERDDVEIVQLLLQHGARPDFKDEHGQTPLSRATRAGNVAVIALLNSIS